MYAKGSILCRPQLARSETKVVLTSPPSSLPTKSQFFRPTLGDLHRVPVLCGARRGAENGERAKHRRRRPDRQRSSSIHGAPFVVAASALDGGRVTPR
jgi:hypothetical protein